MENLIEALKVIKGECEKHNGCESCPMYDVEDLECGLLVYNSPSNWKIRDSVKIIYSVLGGD